MYMNMYLVNKLCGLCVLLYTYMWVVTWFWTVKLLVLFGLRLEVMDSVWALVSSLGLSSLDHNTTR